MSSENRYVQSVAFCKFSLLVRSLYAWLTETVHTLPRLCCFSARADMTFFSLALLMAQRFVAFDLLFHSLLSLTLLSALETMPYCVSWNLPQQDQHASTTVLSCSARLRKPVSYERLMALVNVVSLWPAKPRVSSWMYAKLL